MFDSPPQAIAASFRRRPESSRKNQPAQRTNTEVVLLRRKWFDRLDSGLRRNDGSED